MFSLFGTNLNYAQVDKEPSATAVAQPEARHLMGKWICNNDPADVYQINPDKTAQHFRDKGNWQVADNLLTISWENGFRLIFDTNQTGPAFTGLSYPPGKIEPDKLLFSCEENPAPAAAETPAVPAVTLPAERTLTSADGRQMAGSVLSKSDSGIKFRRTSDNKEFEIPLDKLSAEDRTWVDNATMPAPRKLRVLVLDKENPQRYPEFELFKKHGCEVVFSGNDEESENRWKPADIEKIPQEEMLKYDIIWTDKNTNNPDKLITTLKQFGGVAVVHDYRMGMTRRKFLDDGVVTTKKHNPAYNPYVRDSVNFVFYVSLKIKRRGIQNTLPDMEAIEKMVTTAIRLTETYRPGTPIGVGADK
jgi:hypothetical protein